ncbi:MAG: hypothetical protein ABEJ99_00505 [Candidatus Nanohaloarchaea archaeon]
MYTQEGDGNTGTNILEFENPEEIEAYMGPVSGIMRIHSQDQRKTQISMCMRER